MNKTSIVCFGTHNFATTILQGLLDDPNISVDLVITAPDKPVGRKQEMQESPIKLLAKEKGIPIYQPEKLKIADFKFQILESPNLKSSILNLQLGVVAQYGLIIPQSIIDAFPLGILNTHTSLLPKYRGASPIQTALMNGEKETGVTIMKLDAGMDTGPILAQKTVVIEPDETYTTLDTKLAKIGQELLLKTIPEYVSGASKPVPQDNSLATYTKQLDREDGRVDWQKNAEEIYNQWRGLTPWPGVWTIWKDKRVKLLRIKPATDIVDIKDIGYWILENNKIFIKCKQGAIEIEELQIEGKNKQTAKEFINGYKNTAL